MKKIIIIITILSSILFADLSKMINLPNNSKILSLTFRYIDTNGNMKTEKLKGNIRLTSDGIFLSQSKQEHFLAKIDIKDISKINSFVIEYKNKSNNKFFKPIYYNLAMLTKNKPLYVLQNNYDMMGDMVNDDENMPLMPDMSNMMENKLIDGFSLDSQMNAFKKKKMKKMKKSKVMEFKQYNLSYINDSIHPVILDGIDISKKEKHFCTIPIRDNIFYFTNKKALYVIFKDFELTSDMSIENNQITIKFEQENKFRPCELNNINKHIRKMSAFHEEYNDGEAWFYVHFSSNIKSASIVYPKEKSEIMSYNKELKDIIVYKIEY